MSHASRIHSAKELLVKNFENHLSAYSASAVMAGVSLLALAQPAEGEIVVTHVDTGICGAAVDINNDGVPDFEFVCYATGYMFFFYKRLLVEPLTGGRVVGGARGSGGPYASALTGGAKIGPSAQFSSSVGVEQLLVERSWGTRRDSTSGTAGYGLVGQWGNTGTHYLGVKFLINGQTHYGWIQMTVTRPKQDREGLNGTIHELAYETTPNMEIAAGATRDDSATTEKPEAKATESANGPSLGMLAFGAQGIAMWRR